MKKEEGGNRVFTKEEKYVNGIRFFYVNDNERKERERKERREEIVRGGEVDGNGPLLLCVFAVYLLSKKQGGTRVDRQKASRLGEKV